MNKPPIENRTLFTGDNLEVMRAMNSETVDLIYLDPPFNKKFVFVIGKSETKEFGYKDIWGWETPKSTRNPFLPYAELYAYGELLAAAANGNPLIDRIMAKKIICFLDAIGEIAGHAEMAYLSFMAPRLVEMRRLLKPTGNIYLHCDPTMSHSLKLLMDIIFGNENFRNEIVWAYRTGGVSRRWFPRKHDLIFYYGKTDKITHNPLQERIRYTNPFFATAQDEAGYYADVYIRDVWEIKAVLNLSSERIGFPTQKPLELLERIITASSNEGDLILDPFCGCATTCIAAERLNRQWIGVDVSSKAAKLVNGRLNEETKQGSIHEGMRIVKHRRFDKGDCPMRTDLGEKRSKNIKQILYGKQNGNCNLCKTHFKIQHFHLDHITPRAKGGPDCDRNLQLLCGSCNTIKSTRTMENARKRLRELGYV